MIFNSVTYLAFLAVCVCLYWVLPRRPRVLMLLMASLMFYGFWRLDFLFLLLASIVVDWCVALAMERTHGERRRRAWLMVSVVSNLGILAFFKYTLFFVGTVNGIAQAMGFETIPVTWKIILPLGISFYIFQTMSYTIDVYRRFVPAQRDFVLFATFVTFFPQLVAGPILRAREVIEQLDTRPPFRGHDLVVGLRRVIVGLFLKVVLADNIAGFVDYGFGMPAGSLSGWDVWTLAFLFGFQIYFDFSAYSHIAVGSARMMGIHFPENFRFPYLASSPREFWRRWHISLSSWVRDYLYLPLCGLRVRDNSIDGLAVASDAPRGRRAVFALWVSWALMGLWHGANWTFVVWGLWHATLISLHRLVQRLPKPRRPGLLAGWLATLPLIMLGWIPFRAASLSDTLAMWVRVVDPQGYFIAGGSRMFGLVPQPMLTLSREAYLTAACLCLATALAGWLAQRVLPRWREDSPGRLVAETAAWAVCIPLTLVYLRPVHQFIYFQF